MQGVLIIKGTPRVEGALCQELGGKINGLFFWLHHCYCQLAPDASHALVWPVLSPWRHDSMGCIPQALPLTAFLLGLPRKALEDQSGKGKRSGCILPSFSLFSVSVAQSCLTLCDSMDCSPPGPSVHGTFQARILEWVAMPSSRRSSWPRNGTRVSHIAGRFFTIWAIKEAPIVYLLKSLWASHW